eukprot:9968773-Ditylum_brightwellii.AAC.1
MAFSEAERNNQIHKWYIWQTSCSKHQEDLMRELDMRNVSHQVGSLMCYWILTKAGHVVAKTTVNHVTHDEYLDKETKKQIKEFNEAIDKRLNDDHFKNNDLAGFYLDDELDDPA